MPYVLDVFKDIDLSTIPLEELGKIVDDLVDKYGKRAILEYDQEYNSFDLYLGGYHNWKYVEDQTPNLYDSLYECTSCKEKIIHSIDGKDLPETGCNHKFV